MSQDSVIQVLLQKLHKFQSVKRIEKCCFYTAVFFSNMLNEVDIKNTVHIGFVAQKVRANQVHFTEHCWVEVDNKVIETTTEWKNKNVIAYKKTYNEMMAFLSLYGFKKDEYDKELIKGILYKKACLEKAKLFLNTFEKYDYSTGLAMKGISDIDFLITTYV